MPRAKDSTPQGSSQKLRANSLLQSLQLPFHRTIVNRAADADYRASKERRIPPVSCPHFLPGQLPNLGFELTLLGVAEFARAGDLRFGKAQPRIQFLFQLRNNRPQKMHSPMINQDRDQ